MSTRDLMARMGHDSMRAALIYQHVSAGADTRISSALDAVWAEAKGAEKAQQGRSDEAS